MNGHSTVVELLLERGADARYVAEVSGTVERGEGMDDIVGILRRS